MLVRMRVWRLATLLTLGLGGLGPVATLYPGRGVIAVADASTCPSGWNCADIGSPSAGDQSLSAGAWTVQGLGQDITGSADQFHYVYQTVAGDSSLTVRLTSQTNTGVCAKAGIMYRADTSADAPDYDAVMTPNCAGTSNSIFIQYRTAQGGSTAAPAHLAVSLPVYLRIERVGNSFATYTSPDGNVWSIVAGSSASVSLPSTALAGIAVSSFNAATPSIATFDNVAINTQDYTTCPSDWACADIGTPALPGGQALSSGAWTVRGSGTDITGSADQFHYVYRTVVGDSSMIVRLTS